MTDVPARIKAAGVTWRDCAGCGLPWPFPKGVHEDRDWLCHRCLNGKDAAFARSAGPALLKRYLDNHCQAADQDGMSALCECRLCLDTRAHVGRL
jgi:hypothetical protein